MATLAIILGILALTGLIFIGIGLLIFKFYDEDSVVAACFCIAGGLFFICFSIGAVVASDVRDSQRNYNFSTHCSQSGGTPYRTFDKDTPVCLKGVK